MGWGEIASSVFKNDSGQTNWTGIISGLLTAGATVYAVNQQKKAQEHAYQQQMNQYNQAQQFQTDQINSYRNSPAALLAPYLMSAMVQAYGGKLAKFGINLPIDEMLGRIGGGSSPGGGGATAGASQPMGGIGGGALTNLPFENAVASVAGPQGTIFDPARAKYGGGGHMGQNSRIQHRTYEDGGTLPSEGGYGGGTIDYDIFAGMQDPGYFQRMLGDSFGRIDAENGQMGAMGLNPNMDMRDWERMGAGLTPEDVLAMNKALGENHGFNRKNMLWKVIQYYNPLSLPFTAVRQWVGSDLGQRALGMSPDVVPGFMTEGNPLPYYNYEG